MHRFGKVIMSSVLVVSGLIPTVNAFAKTGTNEQLTPSEIAFIKTLVPTRQELASVQMKVAPGQSWKMELPNYARVKSAEQNPNLSTEMKKIIDGIPTSISFTNTTPVTDVGEIGDPTASGYYQESSWLGIPIWFYKVTQDFSDNGQNVTWLGAAQNDPAVWYPGWSLSNESNSSSTVPYSFVQSYNQGVFSYTPYDLVTIETQVCNINFTMYGDGGWYANVSMTTN